eukprot:TRINITY_DN16422_c0_g1_i1.p1 TRINITY_DN16422_c0_g1~~TRINITY_DN16422_c0_g1_i1.p1  ORF type:complete len:215 (-),score=38.16 TRINITY_DN16422_c0_g1_i1:157-774(-)
MDRNIHPNSRKARQLVREKSREKRLKDAKQGRVRDSKTDLTKLEWFKSQLMNDKTRASYGESSLAEQVALYIQRNDQAYLDLKKQLDRFGASTNPTKARKFSQLEDSIRHEREEFFGPGVAVPDLTNPHCVKLLREWDGKTLGRVSHFAVKRVKADEEIELMFPDLKLLPSEQALSLGKVGDDSESLLVEDNVEFDGEDGEDLEE